ncbi:MAG: class I SAM-dependent methyltransferase [Anaerolineae bacterium]|nr:class I SAM-dependent methyltransferase [Anaerolineae bacterium]
MPNLADHKTVTSSHYWNSWYLSPRRMSSIGWQYYLCTEINAATFLEIGMGAGILTWMLRKSNKSVVTSDLVMDLKPDIITRLPTLAFRNRIFDAITCFQVLEHLPFDQFATSLKEMKRVSKQWIILSLPDKTKQLPLKVQIARRVYQFFKFPPRWKPRPLPISIDPQHCWEIGYDGITYDTILGVASSLDLHAVEHFRNELNPYHYYFLLERMDI